MRRLLFPLLCASLALAPVAAAADEPQTNASLTVLPERPAANDMIRVVYTFSGPGAGGGLRVPSSLPLKGLTIAGGPSTSTSVEMINFDVRRSVSVTWFVRAQAQGPAEIGEATFEIGGKPVKVAGRALEIGPPRAGPSPDEQQEEDPFDRFFRRRPAAVPPDAGMARRGEPAVIEYLATPEKTTAYVGEEITITYELVTQVDIDGLEPAEPPKYPGCWAEDLERPEHPQGVKGEWEGKRVMRFLLQKKSVSGLAPGVVTLPPAKVRLAVRGGGGDPFGDPFGVMRRQLVERSTKPIALKILPIPGAKGDFKGPNGRFDVSAKLDPREVAAGSATTLKVRISGVGNLRTATDPPHVAVAGARLYPPTRAAEPQKSAGKTTESIEWDYVLVPNAPGALTIPAISLEVFDPAVRRILTKTTSPITLAVEGTAVAVAPAAPGTAGNAVIEERPIAAAPLKGAVSQRPTPTPSGPRAINLTNQTVTVPIWLLAAVPGGLFVLGTAAVFVRRRRRAQGAILAAVAPEAEETKERAAARIERALRTLLAARGVPEALPSAQVPDAMRTAGEAESRVGEVRDLLSDLDFLRFAPQLGDYSERISTARAKASRLLPRLR